MENQNQPVDVYNIVTTRIIEQLEQQVIPWRQPWTEGGHPKNLFTNRPYTGINTWLLGSLGYSHNYFLTWRQIKTVGASVKKGERGAVVIFWKRFEVGGRQQSILRYYRVFNIDQVSFLPEVITIPFPTLANAGIAACEEIVERMPNCPTIRHGKQKAYYDPATDLINMPKQGTFASPTSYYCTLFHELIHSTGHQSRLNRRELVESHKYDSDPYGIEELTAEIGACYLNSIAGIINKEFDSSVAYIKGWVDLLRNNNRLIVYASAQAEKATNYILNVKLRGRGQEVVVEEKAEAQ